MERSNIKELLNECLQCKNPTCIDGCPASNNIKEFIRLSKLGKYDEAYEEILKTSTLPSICSLVCPHEKQCMGHCVKNKINAPVNIPKIEFYLSTVAKKSIPNTLLSKSQKVAIIGSGPAGLACAETLAKLGYHIDIYDSYDIPGGILTYGIPDFVLSKNIVNEKIEYLKTLKINFIMNKSLGKNITISSLSQNYDALFIAIGASIGKKMGISNENLKGVIDANDFLKKVSRNDVNEYKDIENVIVVGGGNTAIDAARSASRLFDGNVSIVYRRSQTEMPARNDEIIKAKQDGIQFNFLTNPVSFIGNEKLEEVECIKMRLEKVDNDRARPIVIENSNFKIKADLVIEAVSSTIDTSILENIKCNSWGGIIVNDAMQTSIKNVFAGGDCVSGPSLVVTSMKDGINAAKNIDKYLSHK